MPFYWRAPYLSTGGSFHGVTVTGAQSLSLSGAEVKRMCAVVPQFLRMSSWYGA
jgi:hypothetical protein